MHRYILTTLFLVLVIVPLVVLAQLGGGISSGQITSGSLFQLRNGEDIVPVNNGYDFGIGTTTGFSPFTLWLGTNTSSPVFDIVSNASSSIFRLTGNGQLQIRALQNCNTIDTDSTGQLACGTDEGGAGTPAGSTGEIQFNSSGSFGASSNLFWNNSLFRLGLATGTPGTVLSVTGAGLVTDSLVAKIFKSTSTSEASIFPVASSTSFSIANLLQVSGAGTSTFSGNQDVTNHIRVGSLEILGSCKGCPAGGSGTPGGSNTQVQYNDSSSFGGDANFTWNKNTTLLGFTYGSSTSYSLSNLLNVSGTGTSTFTGSLTTGALSVASTTPSGSFGIQFGNPILYGSAGATSSNAGHQRILGNTLVQGTLEVLGGCKGCGTSGGGAWTLLKANSGTDTTATANNVDTTSITGLTSTDKIYIFGTYECVTAGTVQPLIQNSTDSVTVVNLNGTSGDCIAAEDSRFEVVIQQFQNAATKVGANSRTTVVNAERQAGNVSTFTTNWTGTWTVAFRHGGVVATGTFRWSWSVYKVSETSSGGTINSGTTNRITYYSGATTLDSANFLGLSTDGRLGINATSTISAPFSLVGAGVVTDSFTSKIFKATSTSEASIFPIASTTSLSVGNLLNIVGAGTSTNAGNQDITSHLRIGSLEILGACKGCPAGGGGTPGGSNTQFQFNDSSSFGGAANLVYVSNLVGIGSTTPGAMLGITGNFAQGGGEVNLLGNLRVGTLTATSSGLFPNGVTITCTSCLTDANVSNTLTASDLVAGSSVVANAEVDDDITLTNITQITTRPITSLTTSAAAGSIFFSDGSNPSTDSNLTFSAADDRLTTLFASTTAISLANLLNVNGAGTSTFSGFTDITGHGRFGSLEILNAAKFAGTLNIIGAATSTFSGGGLSAAGLQSTANGLRVTGDTVLSGGLFSSGLINITGAGTSTFTGGGSFAGLASSAGLRVSSGDSVFAGGIRVGAGTSTFDGNNDITSHLRVGSLEILGACKGCPTGGGAGTPGGSASEIQYRVDGTTFGGASNTAWDNTNFRLGIGTTTPGANLSVHGGGIFHSTTTFMGGILGPSIAATSSLGFYTGGALAPRMYIDSSGNIGVGTTTPANLFSVGGLALYGTGGATSTNIGGYKVYGNVQILGGLEIGGGCKGCPTGGGAGTPGGSDRQIQFNDNSSFGGNASFLFTSGGEVAIATTTGSWGKLNVGGRAVFDSFLATGTAAFSGIGTTSPGALFSVHGAALFKATTTVEGIDLRTSPQNGCYSINGKCLTNLTLGNTDTTIAQANVYCSPFDSGLCNTTEANVGTYILPWTTTFTSLGGSVEVAPGAGKDWNIVLRAGQADTALNCTINGTNTSCNATTTQSVTIAAGTQITFGFITNVHGGTAATAGGYSSVTVRGFARDSN